MSFLQTRDGMDFARKGSHGSKMPKMWGLGYEHMTPEQRREKLKSKILKIIKTERTKPVMMISYEQYQEELEYLDNRIAEKILQLFKEAEK